MTGRGGALFAGSIDMNNQSSILRMAIEMIILAVIGAAFFLGLMFL